MFESLSNDRVTFGEYYKMTKNIFFNNFNSIFLLALAIFIPFLIVEALLSGLSLQVGEAINYLLTEDMVQVSKVEEYTDLIMKYVVISSLEITFFGSLISGTMANVTKKAVQLEEIKKGDILKNTLKKIITLFFSRLLFIVIIALSTVITVYIPLLFFIPLYVSTIMIFHIEENVFNNKSVIGSITSSIKLIRNKRGRFLDILMFYTMIGIISSFASFVLIMIASSFNIYGEIGTMFSSFLVYVFLLIFSIPMTLKYINFNRIDGLISKVNIETPEDIG